MQPGLSLPSATPDATDTPPKVPSDSQRAAIEAPAKALLVLAGPGAGKTYCLIERIRYLLEILAFDPARICAFTFTNKAAGEIAERLERTLGDRASLLRTGTIHAFCAELLREFGSRIGIQPGFGIADEAYQRTVLRRLGYQPQFCGNLLTRFTKHRYSSEPFEFRKDAQVFERYEQILSQRRMLDFDSLVVQAARLLRDKGVLQRVQARWDCILVDEFQDLNPYQYEVVREIGREHGHIFAVGDEEQSIYSWAGADPRVFKTFLNDFAVGATVNLRENRRCPREILAYARRLIEINPSLFDQRKELESQREVPGCISALSFANDDDEMAWVIADLRRRRDEQAMPWGDAALLYRSHRIGDAAESALLAAGVPCRLAHGRAIGDDPVVAYVVAAIRVIADPDETTEEALLETVLPAPLLDAQRAQATESGATLRQQLAQSARALARDDADGKKIRRAFSALNNLATLGERHRDLVSLVEDLLAQRVGTYRTALEEHHDALTDPDDHDEVVRLADRLASADGRHVVWLPRLGGLEIPLRGMLVGVGIGRVAIGGLPPDGAVSLAPDDAPVLGLPLALFKALQRLRGRRIPDVFRDFTAIDIETTTRKVDTAEVTEIAVVRVRHGVPVDEYVSLVRPCNPITPGASRATGITDDDVRDAPTFEEVWPRIRAFCGTDLLVAHNGYHFDFPILRRLSGEQLHGYDTLPLARDLQRAGSCKLPDLARHFGIDAGQSHRALDDTRALARVCLALHATKNVVARKTSLVQILDHLGVALALWREEGTPEVEFLRRVSRAYALGRYSNCLDFYEAERAKAEDSSLPTLHQLVEWLGGEQSMHRIRAEKTADQRYPASMARLRRLLDQCGEGLLAEQITRFLDCIALSRSDGVETDGGRVNLLTLHSTKGLEFERVYMLGVEDAQLPGGSQTKRVSPEELEEARRLVYVGMTRAKERLVLTHVGHRGGQPAGGHRFLDEMGLPPKAAGAPS